MSIRQRPGHTGTRRKEMLTNNRKKDRTFTARKLMGSDHHRVFMHPPDLSVLNLKENRQRGLAIFERCTWLYLLIASNFYSALLRQSSRPQSRGLAERLHWGLLLDRRPQRLHQVLTLAAALNTEPRDGRGLNHGCALVTIPDTARCSRMPIQSQQGVLETNSGTLTSHAPYSGSQPASLCWLCQRWLIVVRAGASEAARSGLSPMSDSIRAFFVGTFPVGHFRRGLAHGCPPLLVLSGFA
jgi:hypothetical protein